MNRHQVKGRVEEAKGKIKEEVGQATGNASLEQKGRVQKNLGKGQAAAGDVAERVKSGTREGR
ncbi:CsbD family protein [Aquabacterium sp. J223]|uniref:CsbD family protein n=1 Tax=Aquabacterium sp. J223 TaxID=2898431 RepID=UPI0021ADE4C6|nr:CsbD family protein [Aquabacterium sp. J223]UUX96289.1 CsbD family protein [Aquabacterium sp. J223]